MSLDSPLPAGWKRPGKYYIEKGNLTICIAFVRSKPIFTLSQGDKSVHVGTFADCLAKAELL